MSILVKVSMRAEGNMKTLLIIDDETDLCESIREILNGTFDSIVAVDDGEKALNFIKYQQVPWLIISDVMMPKLDGIELMSHIKSLGFSIPVIFITGSGDREILLRALRLGASDLLEKPFTQEALVKTVNRVKEILKRRENITRLEKLYGADNPEVIHERKMLGLLETVNSYKKSS